MSIQRPGVNDPMQPSPYGPSQAWLNPQSGDFATALQHILKLLTQVGGMPQNQISSGGFPDQRQFDTRRDYSGTPTARPARPDFSSGRSPWYTMLAGTGRY